MNVAVRDLDNAEVRAVANLWDAAAEQSHTNLHGYIVLKDVIEVFEDVLKDAIGEVGFEKRGSPAVVEMVAPPTYCVQFRIGQFTHFTHGFPPYPCRDVSNSNVRWGNQVWSTALWVDIQKRWLPLRAQFAQIGVEAGKPFSVEKLSPEQTAELETAMKSGIEKIKQKIATSARKRTAGASLPLGRPADVCRGYAKALLR
jgi:hypothetical protein